MPKRPAESPSVVEESDDDRNSQAGADEDAGSEEEAEYEIEAIVKHKIGQNNKVRDRLRAACCAFRLF